MDQQINLYLDLEEGEFADLEVVARASLFFAAAVREISYIVDPSLTIKLEFESGTEGSLSINSIVRFIHSKYSDEPIRASIITAILTWFALETGAALVSIIVTDIIKGDSSISEHDAQLIADKVQLILDKKIGVKPVQGVFKELEKDKSIKGVGVGTKKGDRPKSIVPRSEFYERSGGGSEDSNENETRIRPEKMNLTLISPVLQKSNNKWRFLSKDGIIYAAVKDEKFLEDMLSGRLGITMKSGIIILANVQIKEKRQDKVWEITERTVTEVLKITINDDTDDLFSNK